MYHVQKPGGLKNEIRAQIPRRAGCGWNTGDVWILWLDVGTDLILFKLNPQHPESNQYSIFVQFIWGAGSDALCSFMILPRVCATDNRRKLDRIDSFRFVFLADSVTSDKYKCCLKCFSEFIQHCSFFVSNFHFSLLKLWMKNYCPWPTQNKSNVSFDRCFYINLKSKYLYSIVLGRTPSVASSFSS